MIIDPHIHSTYSGDSTATVKDIVKHSRKIGLDAIAIADHDSLKGSDAALKEFGRMDDLVIIPAMEVSTSKGHIVALGISEEIPKKISPEETIELIRVQGGIAVVAHPFVAYRDGLFTNVDYVEVDAMETLNSRYIFGYSNWRAKKLAEEKNIPQIGSSDAHFLGAIGSCVTELEADFSVDSILKGILAGKTTVYGDRTPLPLILKEVINKKIRRI
ncbi:PHP domain-containing protein [Methanobacterium petrolearium]|uniref:PHP domain-containing protein n=1 Tax=Methanobacterium petrolearium TaxID=710190 RepID=UPI001AE3D8BF|nr:PHP domain-containing protein [Methanobacterium petrolearium]MBP1944875.1 putative metal-dependent phosphoesterase TrpH [Methanobacterium petrolearium]BDZ70180.1 histidinol-phosphatase [Methanobacterium petrolearium]